MRLWLPAVSAFTFALLAVATGAATAQQADTAPFTVRPRLAHGGTITGLAFSQDGRRLISAADDNAIYVWDMQAGVVIRTIAQPTDQGLPPFMATGLYAGPADVVTVLDADVMRQGLQHAFLDLQTQIRPNDVFVLYMAGHGFTDDGRYYFLPYDFHLDDDNSIAKFGIGQDQLQDWLAQIPALRAVLIYDTCESGSAAADSPAFRGDEKLIAVEHMTRSMGRTVLSASSDSAPAIEGYQGHGVFTFAILDALSQADANHDGTIEVSELASYLKDRVPELSFKAFAVRQTPEVKISGGDFLLVKRVAPDAPAR